MDEDKQRKLVLIDKDGRQLTSGYLELPARSWKNVNSWKPSNWCKITNFPKIKGTIKKKNIL